VTPFPYTVLKATMQISFLVKGVTSLAPIDGRKPHNSVLIRAFQNRYRTCVE
jgi:hypothetical protein